MENKYWYLSYIFETEVMEPPQGKCLKNKHPLLYAKEDWGNTIITVLFYEEISEELFIQLTEK